jgi:SagB-type dehydrogenase family enzyme
MGETRSDPAEAVLAYHERSKHHPRRYAAGPGYLDWDNQPDPFRTYDGAPRVELPLAADGLQTSYADLFRPAVAPAATLSLESLGSFFELSLGITAWKRYQSARWSLRANPSSGNLHPTEGWLLVQELAGIPAGVYHYVARDHVLERRCSLLPDDSAKVAAVLGSGGFLILFSTIHWREAWKYGERAFRYCQHDLGHAIAAARFAAAALGWRAALLDGLGDDRIARLLGLDREEDFRHLERFDRERPETALWIAAQDSPSRAAEIEASAPELADVARRGAWRGRANPLSPEHVEWAAIEGVADATRRAQRSSWIDGAQRLETEAASRTARRPPAREEEQPGPATRAPWPPFVPARTEPAASLLRRRRSAVAYDGATSIPAAAFFELLDAVLPRLDTPPWDALTFPPRVHLGIFVHRVRGLTPGLYLLERDPSAHDELRAALHPDFEWARAPGGPPHLPLFLLRAGDFRDAGRATSCLQDIGADGVFCLGMVARFEPVIRADPSDYRRLFWEAGAIGQVLYLEAEAAGVRATGIGCHFDDLFHEVLGLRAARFQVVYHFSAGGPVEDPRLQTEPAYGHLESRRRIRARRSCASDDEPLAPGSLQSAIDSPRSCTKGDLHAVAGVARPPLAPGIGAARAARR